MKNLILLFLVQVFLITPSFASVDAPEVKETFKNCNFFKQTEGIYEFANQMLNEISSRSGVSFVSIDAPIKRCIQMMIAGEVDTIVSIRVTELRKSWIDFLFVSEGLTRIVFYTRKADNNWLNEYEDLQGKKIGTTVGFNYFDKFDLDESVVKVKINDPKQLPKLLAAGRIDAYATYSGLMDAHEYPDIVEAPYAYAVKMSVMAIAKESSLQSHRPQLEKAIMGLVTDGTMSKLRTTHLSGFKMPDSKSISAKPAE
jgi:ABC-type amino acid transport substrate-binding protein